ncbi:MAG: hypothetical protein ABFS38_01750 [Bacteroidota bacterium]
MKKFSKLHVFGVAFLISMLTLTVSGQGGGQGGGPGAGRGFQVSEEDIKERVDNLGETLKFSKEQHKKILEYEMEFYNKMQVERQKYTGDREAMRATMMKAREERDKKYEEVLTKEQMAKFKEIQEQRRSDMRRQYQEKNPEGDADRPARGRGRN